jgi:yeast amino acid transporter
MIIILCCYGYATFLPGNWDIGNFFIYYLMLFVLILTYSGWKITKRTKVIPAAEVDLIWEAPNIDAYKAVEAIDGTPGLRKRMWSKLIRSGDIV